MFTNGLKTWVFIYEPESKDSPWSRNTLSDKEKIPGAAVSKEGHTNSLLEDEKTLSLLIYLKKVQL